MYKGGQILGRKIVAYGTGEQVGRVQDLIFDHQSNQVLGLLIDEGSWFGKARVVPMSAVQSIGIDSVIINTKDAIVNAEDIPEVQAILDHKKILKNCKIMTENGQDLGTFLDIYFDGHTGALSGYEVSGGLFADIYSGRSFVPAPLTLKIGKEYAFVENEVADRMKEHTGGLKSALETTGEKLQSITEVADETLQSTKAVVGEKIQAAQQVTEQKLHGITDSVEHQLQGTREAVESAWQSAVDKTTETVEKALPHHSVEQAQGRRVQQAVQTETGLYIAAAGQIVTEEMIEKARQYRQESALLKAVGLTLDHAIRTEAQDWLSQSGEKIKTSTQNVGKRLHEGLKQVKAVPQSLWGKVRNSPPTSEPKPPQQLQGNESEQPK